MRLINKKNFYMKQEGLKSKHDMANKNKNIVSVGHNTKTRDKVIASAKFPSIENMNKEGFGEMLEKSYKQAKNGEGRPANEVLDEIRNEIKNG
jgi:hypothetical protein